MIAVAPAAAGAAAAAQTATAPTSASTASAGTAASTGTAAAETAAAGPAVTPLGATSTGGAALTADGSLTPAAATPSAAAGAADPGFTAVTHRNGSRTVNVTTPGATIASFYRDTFLVHGAAATTFVFDPGYGHDVLKDFRVDGADHDTISLPGDDFSHAIARVLHQAQGVPGGTRIVDPVSGDSILLAGVTKAQLMHNRQDFAFHDAAA